MNGSPKQGQSLEEVQGLLLDEVEKLKKGEFDASLIQTIIKNKKKDRLSQLEQNWLRGYILSDVFIMGADWSDVVNYYDNMSKITKEEVVAWVNAKLNNNYCVVYKRTGEDTNTYKVDNPSITPVELNREEQSDFYKDFEKWSRCVLLPSLLITTKHYSERTSMNTYPSTT